MLARAHPQVNSPALMYDGGPHAQGEMRPGRGGKGSKSPRVLQHRASALQSADSFPTPDGKTQVEVIAHLVLHARTARAGVLNGSRECRCDALRNEITVLRNEGACVTNVSLSLCVCHGRCLHLIPPIYLAVLLLQQEQQMLQQEQQMQALTRTQGIF